MYWVLTTVPRAQQTQEGSNQCTGYWRQFPGLNTHRGSSWLWSYDSWIYNYLCNQCLSPLMLWIRTLLMARFTRYNIMWSILPVTC